MGTGDAAASPVLYEDAMDTLIHDLSIQEREGPLIAQLSEELNEAVGTVSHDRGDATTADDHGNKADANVPGSQDQPPVAKRGGSKRRQKLLLGVAVIALGGVGTGAFFIFSYNHHYKVPQMTAAVRRATARAGIDVTPLLAPSAALAKVELPPAVAVPMHDKYTSPSRERQLGELLGLRRPQAADQTPGAVPPDISPMADASQGPHEPGAAVPRPQRPQMAVSDTAAPTAPAGTPQSSPEAATPGPGAAAPPPGYVPHEPGAKVPGEQEADKGGVQEGASARPRDKAHVPSPSDSKFDLTQVLLADIEHTTHTAEGKAWTSLPRPTMADGQPAVSASPTTHPAASAAAPAATTTPISARAAPASVASPVKPATPADPVKVATEMLAAPLASAQQVQVLELVSQIATMVRDERRADAQLRADLARISADSQARLADFERRLALYEARTAVSAADHVNAAMPPAPAAAEALPVSTRTRAMPTHVEPVAPDPIANRPRLYRVQAASPGLAMLAEVDRGGGAGAQLQVSVGDQLPGYGRVKAIAQHGPTWVVATEHGNIQ